MAAHENQPLHPSMVLSAYCEALAVGKRVVVLGDSSTGLCARLAEMSGRRVHGYDPDPDRTAASLAASSRSGSAPVSYAVLESELDIREGAFDLAIVPDLSEFDDAEDIVALVRSFVGSRGVAVLALPNHEAVLSQTPRGGVPISYLEFFDLASARFSNVRMLGQAAFLGYTIAEFASEDDPAVTIDASLMDTTEEALLFVAVASEQDSMTDPYTLVQVPSGEASAWFLGSATSEAGDPGALAKLRQERARLLSELDRLKEKAGEQGRLDRARRETATALSARVAELEEELQQARHGAKEELNALQDKLERTERHLTAGREADQEAYQEELDIMLDRIAELESEAVPVTRVEGAAIPAEADLGQEFQVNELKMALDEVRSERDSLQGDAQRAADLETELVASRAELVAMKEQLTATEVVQAVTEAVDPADEAAIADDVQRLEQALKDRGQYVQQLEMQLRESDRFGRELIRAKEAAEQGAVQQEPAQHEASANDDSAEVQRMRESSVRNQADLQAAEWKIAALASELEEKNDGSSAHQSLEEALQVAQQEIAELRQKLATVGQPS